MLEKKFSNGLDQFSFANIDSVRTENMVFNFDVDFASKVLDGYVEHHMRTLKEIEKVVLDYSGIQVAKVELLEPEVKAEEGKNSIKNVPAASLLELGDSDEPDEGYIQLESSRRRKHSKEHSHYHHKHHHHKHHHHHRRPKPNQAESELDNSTRSISHVQIAADQPKSNNITKSKEMEEAKMNSTKSENQNKSQNQTMTI